jgi:hypothetical protein
LACCFDAVASAKPANTTAELIASDIPQRSPSARAIVPPTRIAATVSDCRSRISTDSGPNERMSAPQQDQGAVAGRVVHQPLDARGATGPNAEGLYLHRPFRPALVGGEHGQSNHQSVAQALQAVDNLETVLKSAGFELSESSG